MSRYRLLITGAQQIVQITTSSDVAFLRGPHDMNNIKVFLKTPLILVGAVIALGG